RPAAPCRDRACIDRDMMCLTVIADALDQYAGRILAGRLDNAGADIDLARTDTDFHAVARVALCRDRCRVESQRPCVDVRLKTRGMISVGLQLSANDEILVGVEATRQDCGRIMAARLHRTDRGSDRPTDGSDPYTDRIAAILRLTLGYDVIDRQRNITPAGRNSDTARAVTLGNHLAKIDRQIPARPDGDGRRADAMCDHRIGGQDDRLPLVILPIGPAHINTGGRIAVRLDAPKINRGRL